MACSNLPTFGNWESEENIPYTTYFENARRNSSSEKVNTSNSFDNANLVSKQEALRRAEATRTKHECEGSKEDNELWRPVDSLSHHNGAHRTSEDSTLHGPASVRNDALKRAAKPNGTGARSAGHSPLHPHHLAKIGTKGTEVSSPAWERKGSSEGTHSLFPSTPGRSRLRSVPRGSETPDRGASVPKFGEWDESDPSSADGFTHIFDRVKEERHGGGGNAPGTTEAPRANDQRHYRSNGSKACCCFPWGGN